ncbi:transposase [Acanthamoeba polyphaga moumouvirus]|nr:transposase [Acanthamoeba polyphaga moumouvirus]AGC01820.1 putative site-specific integrase-resolvase [Acanthamoeba polyphaga moumouvirus]AQN68174.1 putative site-specific integrase-resolvase [Saudi moumouvirus]
MTKYVRRKEVLDVLKVHYQTLYRMEEKGLIDVKRTNGGHRLYNLDKYLRVNGLNKKEKINVCYCRISSKKQSSDLDNQIYYMKKKYPNHLIIKDIGSGINMERPGLKKLIKMAIDGELNEVVIAYKDRLARFGYELIEWIINTYSSGEIKIINKKEEETPEEEITKDILQIMNVYVAKINGRRKYKNK